MRIAYLSTDPGIAYGGAKGAAVHVEELTRALTGAGAEVLLIMSRSLTDAAEPDDAGRFIEVLPGPAAERDRAAWLEERLREFGPELLYERFALHSAIGTEVARALAIPHFVELNARLVAEAARYRSLEREEEAERLERLTLSGADLVLVVSTPLAAYARARGAHRTEVVPNAVDPAPYAPGAQRNGGRPVAIFAGSLRPWHGIEYLARAWALLGQAAPELVVVGDGPGRTLLEDAGARVTGYVPHASVPDLLAQADIGLAPYAADAPDYFSPLKLFEYLAAGLATIASDLPGVREIVDHESAVLVAPGDADALAAAVAVLASDPTKRRRLGDAGRALVVSRHTWAHRAETILELAEQYAGVRA
jgi:glycosyltransferase involved in cell wall biosynthesis